MVQGAGRPPAPRLGARIRGKLGNSGHDGSFRTTFGESDDRMDRCSAPRGLFFQVLRGSATHFSKLRRCRPLASYPATFSSGNAGLCAPLLRHDHETSFQNRTDPKVPKPLPAGGLCMAAGKRGRCGLDKIRTSARRRAPFLGPQVDLAGAHRGRIGRGLWDEATSPGQTSETSSDTRPMKDICLSL